MTILLFIAVLVVLIVAHELGHFFVAKAFKMRVDEFGVGYPPRAWGIKKGETEYTLNWLPFGGFVKIFGEDGVDGVPDPRSFMAKPKWQQALVLTAGIGMNLLLAYVLLTITLGVGMPRALTEEEALIAPDASLAISNILPGSPAEEAGLRRGDIVTSIAQGETVIDTKSAEAFTQFVASSKGEELTLSVTRGPETLSISATPEAGIIASDEERLALGVGVASFGTIAVPWYTAPIEGAVLTWGATKETAIGLVNFFGSIFTLSADLSQVSGPVGIAGAVGDAGASGIVPLLTLMAIISINLALINLLPFPALDGGRLLFVIIEAITRKRIPAMLAGVLNFGGFALLILLMLVVTASDLLKLLP
jgi:regulator of sigma E protease